MTDVILFSTDWILESSIVSGVVFYRVTTGIIISIIISILYIYWFNIFFIVVEAIAALLAENAKNRISASTLLNWNQFKKSPFSEMASSATNTDAAQAPASNGADAVGNAKQEPAGDDTSQPGVSVAVPSGGWICTCMHCIFSVLNHAISLVLNHCLWSIEHMTQIFLFSGSSLPLADVSDDDSFWVNEPSCMLRLCRNAAALTRSRIFVNYISKYWQWAPAASLQLAAWSNPRAYCRVVGRNS